MSKQLGNFITCSCESGGNPHHIGNRLVRVVRLSSYLTHWAARALKQANMYIDQSETRMPVAAMIFVRSKLHKDILKRTFHTSLLQIFGSNWPSTGSFRGENLNVRKSLQTTVGWQNPPFLLLKWVDDCEQFLSYVMLQSMRGRWDPFCTRPLHWVESL
jgi:hypothetical protein